MAEFKKTKIAVLDFQLVGDKLKTEDIGKIVAEWLITGLVETGRFDVIERALLQKVVEEQKIGISGMIDQRSAAQLGKLLGVKTIVSGTVLSVGGSVEINARLISVETGSIMTAEKVRADRSDRLNDLVSQIVSKIVQAFPVEGYIVQRVDNSITIDLGRMGGIREGMKFIAYKEGKVIRHPKTGEVLDVETVEIGEVEIQNVREKTSNGIILREVAKGAIEYGMMVRSSVKGRLPVLPGTPAREPAPALKPPKPDTSGIPVEWKETQGFLIELLSCRISGQVLTCELNVTNKTAKNRKLYIFEDSKSVDNADKEYEAEIIDMGGHKSGMRGHVGSKFVPNTPVKVLITFEKVDPQIASVKTLEVVCKSESKFNVQFKNISVMR
jgi:TolB-like protein